MPELKAQSRDLPFTGQLKAAVDLLSCAVGLILVVAGQLMVDAFWQHKESR